jgi:hypothetical protein
MKADSRKRGQSQNKTTGKRMVIFKYIFLHFLSGWYCFQDYKWKIRGIITLSLKTIISKEAQVFFHVVEISYIPTSLVPRQSFRSRTEGR